MAHTAVDDIHVLRGLLEGAASIHGGRRRIPDSDAHGLIEDFVRLIRDFGSGRRRVVVA